MMFTAKKSLFDLIRNDSLDEVSSIYLDEKAYIANIIQDISHLLNTRCILPASKRKSHLPLNYGLPYMFGMQEPDDMINPTKQEEWVKALERTLRYFEPRLLRPKITILDLNIQQQTINIDISGNLILNKYPERIRFPLNIQNPY